MTGSKVRHGENEVRLQALHKQTIVIYNLIRHTHRKIYCFKGEKKNSLKIWGKITFNNLPIYSIRYCVLIKQNMLRETEK